MYELAKFELFHPQTLDEALALKTESDETAWLAGGTDLLVKMKRQKVSPRRLININNLHELRGVKASAAGGVIIGASTTVSELVTRVLTDDYPALVQAAKCLAYTQIRNLATVGGNLANASPAAELVPALFVYGAKVRLQGPGRDRVIPIAEFFTGPGKTNLQNDELLTQIILPALPPHSRSGYLPFKLREGHDIALASAAALVVGDQTPTISLSLGSVGPTALHLQWENLLQGDESINKLANLAMAISRPIDDLRASAEYRRALVGIMVRRLVTSLIA